MLKRVGAGLVSLSFLFMLGCATLFNSGSKDVSLNTDPTGATVLVDGNRRGTTPMTLELDNNSSHTVTFQMDGHEDVSCEIGTSVGAGWVILDVLGGLVPVVIDAATGKWNSLEKNSCSAQLPEASTSR